VQTRAYRDGRKVADGFAIEEVSERRAGGDGDGGDLLWIGLTPDDGTSLGALADELGLHPLAVEDVAERGQRVKLDRYSDHLFLSMYTLTPVGGSKGHGFTVRGLTAFVLPDVLVTVADEGFDMPDVLAAWDSHPDLVRCGVGGLVWALLDVVVDSHLDAAQRLDDRLEKVEETILTADHDQRHAQRATFRAHKDVAVLRRYALPMREILDTLAHGDGGLAGVDSEELAPYYRDVDDHVLRVMGWTDALRDIATTLLDANLTVQSNRMNLAMKKVTSWAAIIAVPTLVTGVYGMNVQYPLFGTVLGWWVGAALITAPPVVLYSLFKKNDWL